MAMQSVSFLPHLRLIDFLPNPLSDNGETKPTVEMDGTAGCYRNWQEFSR